MQTCGEPRNGRQILSIPGVRTSSYMEPITSWDCVDKDVGWDANIQRYERSRMLDCISGMSIVAACHRICGSREAGVEISGM